MATDPDTPPVLAHARRLYQAEVGLLTPFVDEELRRLADQHPDPGAWDTAFREAVRANVRKLRYVGRVLEARAHRTSPAHRPGRTSSPRSWAGRPSGPRARPRGGHGYLTDEEYAEAQRRASAVEPLDLETVLGTPYA